MMTHCSQTCFSRSRHVPFRHLMSDVSLRVLAASSGTESANVVPIDACGPTQNTSGSNRAQPRKPYSLLLLAWRHILHICHSKGSLGLAGVLAKRCTRQKKKKCYNKSFIYPGKACRVSRLPFTRIKKCLANFFHWQFCEWERLMCPGNNTPQSQSRETIINIHADRANLRRLQGSIHVKTGRLFHFGVNKAFLPAVKQVLKILWFLIFIQLLRGRNYCYRRPNYC